MKRLILIIIVCCRALGWCHANTQTETDSLYRVAQSLPHDSTRLEMFKRLAQIEQLTPRCITFSGLLREEATLQKNDRYNAIAAYLHTVYYYNQNNRDSVKKWLDTMEPYARKSQTWDLYFDALRFQIDLCTYEEQYELAINEPDVRKSPKSELRPRTDRSKTMLGQRLYQYREMGRRNESIGSCLSTLFTNR